MIRLELSVDSLRDAVVAAQVGADRVELCGSLADGGVTPSHGLIAAAAGLCPVHVLVRPRVGDFCYTATEIDAMIADVGHAVRLRAAGVVAGVLRADGSVDRAATAALLAAAGAAEFTFHRAIDVCADPVRALDVLCDLGVTRVLTSGAAATAVEGQAMIAQLVRRARPGTSIMACGGVRPDNLIEVVRATGVSDVHCAPRKPLPSGTFTGSELDRQVAERLRTLADEHPW